MFFTFVTFLVRAACLTRFTLLILSHYFYPMGSKHHDAFHAVFPHPLATSRLIGENTPLEILNLCVI